jgi:hypothetical protein
MDKLAALLILFFWGCSGGKYETITIEEGQIYQISYDGGCNEVGVSDMARFDRMAVDTCPGRYGYRNVKKDGGCATSAVLICIDQLPAERPIPE